MAHQHFAKRLETTAFGLLLLSAATIGCSSGGEEPDAMGSTSTNTTGDNASATSTSAASAGGSAASSTSGSSTTGSATSAGVLVDGMCVLACMDDSTDADSEGVTDGWGFEMGTSCIVPGGMADTGMACDDPMLAQAPDDPSAPGTGVLVGGTCTRVCNDDSTDDDGSGTLDGWGWEFNASCIVPGGIADPGASEACTDFEMPMASQPGGTVDVDGTCYPVCADDSTDADENGVTDGWGYDDVAGESCIVPGGIADTGMACAS